MLLPSLLVVITINLSACFQPQNPIENDSLKAKTESIDTLFQTDSVAIFQAQLDSIEKRISNLVKFRNLKQTSQADKYIVDKQLEKLNAEKNYLADRVRLLKETPNTSVGKDDDTIAHQRPATQKPTSASEKREHNSEPAFAPLYRNVAPGAMQILLEENKVSYLVYVVDLERYEVHINWADTSNYKNVYNSFGYLLNTVYRKQKPKVKMMMNGGIFKVARDAMTMNEPLGLYVENGKEICSLNTSYPNSDNFYLKPNGVFYWSDNTAGILTTQTFEQKKSTLNYTNAVQSGPMLLIEGKYHPAFKKGSSNLNIRNGVGVTTDGKRLIFAISEQGTNFYDFATLFKHFGCANALYLDGAISRVYMPEKGKKDLGGNFASIITVIEK